MAEFNEKKGIVLSEEDKQIFSECEDDGRTLIFAWKGLAKDWKERINRETEDRLQREDERHCEKDLRELIWMK